MTYSLLGIDAQTGEQVKISQSARRQGVYIIGGSGQGKTGLIENLIVQDIEQGLGVAVLDPHGDLTNSIIARTPDERIQDIILLDITDEEHPFGLNLFACDNLNSSVAVQKIVDQVKHIFEKLFDVNTAGTPLLLQYLRNCTHTLIATPGFTMADISLLLSDKQCREMLLAQVKNVQVKRFWENYERLSPKDKQAEWASLERRIDVFLQPLTYNIVGQSHSTINLRQVMDERKILLVKLDARMESVTSLIGSVFIALLLNAAYSRSDIEQKRRKQFNIYADEFQRFATEDMAILLTEARKFGIATTIGHQTLSQISEKNKAAALQAANIIVFRVSGTDSQELATSFDLTPTRTKKILRQRTEPIYKQWSEEIWIADGEEYYNREVQRHTETIAELERKKEEKLQQLNTSEIDIHFTYRAFSHCYEYAVSDVERHYGSTITLHSLSDFLAKGLGILLDVPLLANTALLFLPDVLLLDKPFRQSVDKNGREHYIFPVETILRQGFLIRWIEAGILARREGSWSSIAFPQIEQAESLSKELQRLLRPFYEQGFWFTPSPSPKEQFQDFEQWRASSSWAYGTWQLNDIPAGAVATFYIAAKEAAQNYQFFTELETAIKDEEARHVQNVRNLKQAYSKTVWRKEYLGEKPVRDTTRNYTESIQEEQWYDLVEEIDQTHSDRKEAIASELANLPLYTARVKFSVDAQTSEHIIKTLKPEYGVNRRKLAERKEQIRENNLQAGYLRKREEVEEEIATRQAQCQGIPLQNERFRPEREV